MVNRSLQEEIKMHLFSKLLKIMLQVSNECRQTDQPNGVSFLITSLQGDAWEQEERIPD